VKQTLALALLLVMLVPTLAHAQRRRQAPAEPEPDRWGPEQPPPPPPNSEAIHAVPIRYADRPLTLPEGSLRLDQSGVLRIGSGLGLSGPNTLSAGLTDWLEIGVAWPWARDPTFLATARLAHSEVVDFAFRVAVTAPALTTGNTDLVVSIPIVFRLAHIARIATGVSGDFLLTQTMQPIVRVPLSVAFSLSPRHALGIEGSLSLVDRHFWHGDIGVFYVHTVTATAVRPLLEVRAGASWEFATRAFILSIGFSFWGTARPT
jgi:hypothetical protein